MTGNTHIINAMLDIATVLAPLRSRIKSDRHFVDKLLHIFGGVTDFRQPFSL